MLQYNKVLSVCLESRSSCGGSGGPEGSEGRASWRVTLDHDLVETLSAIYPEWFKPQHRRERSRAASPESPASPPRTPATPPSDDTFRYIKPSISRLATCLTWLPPTLCHVKAVCDHYGLVNLSANASYNVFTRWSGMNVAKTRSDISL